VMGAGTQLRSATGVSKTPPNTSSRDFRPQEMRDMHKTTKNASCNNRPKRRVMLLTTSLVAWFAVSFGDVVSAQTISREQLVFLTAEWKGERFSDGRPKVPDEVLARIKKVSIEEAWGFLRSHGYQSQFEGDWKMIHNDVPVVGRALTAQYMP